MKFISSEDDKSHIDNSKYENCRERVDENELKQFKQIAFNSTDNFLGPIKRRKSTRL